ncbi:MAG: hypothetical protein JXA67_03900 [Micromonosporaceae bacterium]|nr:hypothetical protein [Micromonosporaceae bacterium]
MSVVSRTVPAIPVRTSTDTWAVIVALLTAPEHAARADLNAIADTAALLIAEEYTRDAPIVVLPAVGDRIRIYTVHGPAAIDDEDPAALATWPLTTPGWKVSLPCGVDDIDEIRAALAPYSFAEVRDTTEGVTVGVAASAPHGTGSISINYDELERP